VTDTRDHGRTSDDARDDSGSGGAGEFDDAFEDRREAQREVPLASFEQRVGGNRNRFELFVDRVTCHASDLLGSRRVTLPLDSLSAHVVVRQRGSVRAFWCGGLAALLTLLAPGTSWTLALPCLLLGGAGWLLARRQYIVFPGQIVDLELYRDMPDAASARRFVAQVVRRIEALERELAALENPRDGDQGFDRVDELLAFRDLYTEGIIDRSELRVAAESLARKNQGRIGFR